MDGEGRLADVDGLAGGAGVAGAGDVVDGLAEVGRLEPSPWPPHKPDTWSPLRAFHSTYPSQLVRLLHILRPTAVEYRKTYRLRGDTVPQGWCGTHASDTHKSKMAWLDSLPEEPPPGLDWCPTCVGRCAQWVGILGGLARSLVAVERLHRRVSAGSSDLEVVVDVEKITTDRV